MNIVIIGLGGIGSVLSNFMSRYLNSRLDIMSEIILVDGDNYEFKNQERQEFIRFGNKADAKADELREKFSNINFKSFPCFVDENSISEIIKENYIVMVGVDNHKTRRLISDYAKTLDNIIVISGGNEYTDGNVQIFIREGGEDVTPSLTDYHPEIKNAIDKSPDEMSCEELSHAEPQLYFTNASVAIFMCIAFYNILSGLKKISETYIDLPTMSVNSKVRAPKNKK